MRFISFSSGGGGGESDGHSVNIIRHNDNENIAPTSAEFPSPIAGSTAKVFLENDLTEYWTYTTSWSKKADKQYTPRINKALMKANSILTGGGRMEFSSGNLTLGDDWTLVPFGSQTSVLVIEKFSGLKVKRGHVLYVRLSERQITVQEKLTLTERDLSVADWEDYIPEDNDIVLGWHEDRGDYAFYAKDLGKVE